jgi:hypothetical protein
MEFIFTVNPIDEEWTGFELGDIEIVTENVVISSRNKAPSQSMMVFLALSSLLDGLRDLRQPGGKTFRFNGIDSSFSILFTIENDSTLSLKNGNFVDVVELSEFYHELLAAAKIFCEQAVKRVTKNDPAITDLQTSIQDMEAFLCSVR